MWNEIDINQVKQRIANPVHQAGITQIGHTLVSVIFFEMRKNRFTRLMKIQRMILGRQRQGSHLVFFHRFALHGHRQILDVDPAPAEVRIV